MIYQTDKRLPKKYGDDECYFFCWLNIYEKVSGVTLTVKQIKKIHDQCTKYGFIGKKGASDGDALINEGGPQGIGMVASTIGRSFVDMRLVRNDVYFSHLVAKFVRKVTGGKDVVHFVEMDTQDALMIEYDPWDANGSRTAREGYIESYRYVLARKL